MGSFAVTYNPVWVPKHQFKKKITANSEKKSKQMNGEQRNPIS